MALIGRVRAALLLALVVLGFVLVAAIVFGILLRPTPPLPFSAVEGTVIVGARGSRSVTGRELHLPDHAVGIAVSCEGNGSIEVRIGSAAGTADRCHAGTVSGAGYVLSTLPGTTYRWRVESRGVRWAVVFTHPRDDGGGTLAP